MTQLQRKINVLRIKAQKGFTLIELAIVGIFLGLLAIFAISQFSGSATDTTRATSIAEASTKIADSWSMLSQTCGVPADIGATNLSDATATGAVQIAAANLNLILGKAGAASAYQNCYNNSGVRALNGLATSGASGVPVIQGYNTTVAYDTTALRLKTTFAGVPENVALSVYNKLGTTDGASTATALPASDTTSKSVQFTVATAGKRDLTVLKAL